MIRPKLWRAYLIFVMLMQVPVVAWLLDGGWLTQLLGATVVGVLLGRALRPLTLQRRWLFLPLSLVVLVAELQLGVPFWMLLDQVFKVTLIVSTWPGDPGDRLRRRLRTVIERTRRWSSGMPVFRWGIPKNRLR